MTVESPVRCEVVFSGHVQGVGFRHTTCGVATNYDVTGYVMNQRDGTVHLVVEGLRPVVSTVIRAVRGRMGSYITDARESWGPATGEFTGFGVRRS
jgi:acylphosphatase